MLKSTSRELTLSVYPEVWSGLKMAGRSGTPLAAVMLISGITGAGGGVGVVAGGALASAGWADPRTGAGAEGTGEASGGARPGAGGALGVSALGSPASARMRAVAPRR